MAQIVIPSRIPIDPEAGNYGPFKGLKERDNVMHHRWGLTVMFTITRITATKIICGGFRFNRQTGKDCYNEDSWIEVVK